MFALERANLILICLPIFSLYIYIKDNKYRAIFLSLLINLKPYFILFYIFEFFNSRKNLKENSLVILTPVISLIIYIASGLLINQDFYLLPLNILNFGVNVKQILDTKEIINFPSSILAFSYLAGSRFELYKILIFTVVYFYIASYLRIIFRGAMDRNDVIIFSTLFLSNYSISSGGYSLLFYIPIIPLLIRENIFYTGMALILIFFGIFDFIHVYSFKENFQSVYLSSKDILINQKISLGSILRPIINLFALILFFYHLKCKYKSYDNKKII